MFKKVTVRTREDALPLVAALSVRTDPGVDVVLAFDRRGVLVAGLPMEPNCSLPMVVALIAGVAAPVNRFLYAALLPAEKQATSSRRTSETQS